MKKLNLLYVIILLLLPTVVIAQDTTTIPGVTINYISAKTGKYIGSPSICVLPNGDYLTSHDEFGPKSTEYKSAQTLVFKSTDKGVTWKKVSQINGQFWSNLFLHKGEVYIMGTNKAHGNVVIRKSSDEGITWTNPYKAENGLILEGEYHTAPTPIAIHNGRIWRAIEYATAESDKWGERYGAVMLSAPVNSDILNAKNWTRSNTVGFDATYLNNTFKGWLEGNAVVDKKGNIVDLLRVHVPPGSEEYTAILDVSKNGKQMTFNKDNFFKMPGSSKKFTIRYDEKSDLYWTIINNIPEDYKDKANPDRIRNFVSIATSPDLKNWTLGKLLFSHPDHKKHGFQYIDWVFEGNDIILVSRTAFDDQDGGASDYHNANFMTFHRVENFRESAKK